MKYIIASVLCFITLTVLAQKDFEGMVRYKITTPGHSDTDEKVNDTVELKIFFTPGKLLLRSNKKESDEDILVVFDSSKVFFFNKKEHTYRTKKLHITKPMAPAQRKMIAGYQSTPVQTSSNNWTQLIGRSSTLWYADSLFFSMPEKFEGNEELIMVKSNRILLNAVILLDGNMFRYGRDEEEEEENKKEEPADELVLEAVEVIPGISSPAIFDIPADFVKEKPYSYSMPDTAVAVMDTIALPAPPKKKAPVKKTPVKTPVKKVIANKSPAKKAD
jgi:hypothetical protein